MGVSSDDFGASVSNCSQGKFSLPKWYFGYNICGLVRSAAPSFGFDGYDLINPAPYVNVSLVPFSCTYNCTANLSCLQPEGSNVSQHGQAPPFNFITGYKMSNFGDGGSSFADDADKSHDTDIFPNVSDSYLLNCCVWYLTLQCYIVYHTSILVNSATPPWSHSKTVAQLTYRRLLV